MSQKKHKFGSELAKLISPIEHVYIKLPMKLQLSTRCRRPSSGPLYYTKEILENTKEISKVSILKFVVMALICHPDASFDAHIAISIYDMRVMAYVSNIAFLPLLS